MIGVITKGRGFMVIVYTLLPASALLFAAKISELLFTGSTFPMEVYRGLGGFALIVSGVLCNRVAKLELKQNTPGLSQFMSVDMKSCANILWVMAGFMLIGTGIEILAFFH